MSTTVDQRVVEMRFDNKQFENNVSSTMSALDKLKQGLKFKGASEGFENITAAANKVDFSQMEYASYQAGFQIRDVWTKVASFLENDIAGGIISTGKRMVAALTIDPIKTGLSEYETQINAVQTILANTESKGSTLEDVNTALDELNTYADKTIYNFTEMTRNIGTFTAAGVDLDTSVNAIQGIANLAAVSGSTSQQASTAMYQLSQALSSGTVKLMDWNSVVNAGMGGQVFQDALKETARVHGIAIDDMIEENGSFRETLQEGWLTADILTETLSHFTMAAEEGSKQWNEYKKSLMDSGYTEDQANAILKLSNTATDAATKVKTWTQLWDTLQETAQSGWTQTWEILLGDFEEAKSLFSDMYGTLSPLIEASSAARNELLEGWSDKGGRTMVVESLFNAIQGLINIVEPIKEAFTDIFPPTTADQLVSMTKWLKNLSESFKNAFAAGSENAEKLKRTFKGLFAVVDIVKQALSAMFNAIKPIFGGIGDLSGGILDLTASWGDWLVNLNETIKKSGIFEKIFGTLGQGISGIIAVIKELGTWVGAIFGTGFEIVQGILARVGDRISQIGGAFGIMSHTTAAAVGAMGATLANSAFFKLMEGIWSIVTGLTKGITNMFSEMGKGIAGTDFSGILDLINTLSIGGIALFLKKLTDGFGDMIDGINDISENVVGILDDVRGCFTAYQESLKAKTLKEIAIAVAILAGSIFVISLIDSGKLTSSLAAIAALFAELLASVQIFSKMDSLGKGSTKAVGVMIGMSVAVLILASALKKIGSLNPTQLLTGLVGVVALAGTMVVAMSALNKYAPNAVKGAMQMILFATAVNILASACVKLSSIGFWEMAQGLLGVGVLLAGISIFLNNTKLQGNAISTGLGIVALAAGMNILASAVAKFGSMSLATLGIGLLGLAGALTVITVAMNFMPANMLSTGIGLLAVSAGIAIMAKAMATLGQLDIAQMGIALLGLFGALAMLTVALNLMNGTLAGAAALLVAAGALAILAPVLKILGGMSLVEVGMALLTLAGAFVVIGAAGYLLAPVAPVILSLAGSLALMSLSILGFGAGLILIGAGFSAIAIGITALATGITGGVVAIVAGITAIITGIIQMIPAIIVAIGQGIVAICGIIVAAAPALAEAIIAILLAVVALLDECVPPIVECVVKLILAILQTIAANISKIVQAAVDLVVGFIDGISKSIPKVIDAAFNLVISFINGLADSIDKNTPLVVEAIDKLFNSLVNAAVTVLTGGVSSLIKAGGNLISGLIQGITKCTGDLVDAGKDIINGFIKGIKSTISKVGDAASEIGKTALNSIKSFLGIKSPSREFMKVGKFADEGMAKGLSRNVGTIIDATKDVGGTMLDSMRNTIANIGDLVSADVDSQPTIRPVLDLSAVSAGAGQISGLLGTPSVGVLANVGAINSRMSARQNGANSELISAISDLKKSIGQSSGNTYNVNGINYSEGDGVAEALETIIRAARVERRS